jgi:hypothetical protein
MNQLRKIAMVITALFLSLSLYADDSYFNEDLAKFGQADVLQFNQFHKSTKGTINEIFSFETPVESSINCSSHKKAAQAPVTTTVYYFQYTLDGSAKQHVAVYSDSVICTNITGPRVGVQFIISNNGALMDMCHNCSMHQDHSTHQYAWGEVNTYSTYQTVVFY